MQEAFRALLLADGGIAAVVDSDPRRIAWGMRPRGTALPAVALHLIDGIPDYAMEGPSGLEQARVQADCWGNTYASATLLSRAVKSVLSGLSATQDGIHFQGVFIDSERDLQDEGTDAEDELFRVSIDFQVWHCEAE